MSAKRSVWLLAALVALLPTTARATGTCTSTCTLGAIQCDPDGGIETCVQQGSGGQAGCTAAAELVYVVDVNNTFSSFTPGPPATFNDIGTLNCPDNNGGTPFSMSVDRSGTAWVIYSDGELFNVDTTTLACTDTGYNNGSWTNFGMGFTTTASGGTTDELFIANVSPLELGILDTSTLGVSTVGTLSGSPELTGNSLAQLWGFFPDANNPRVSELDTSTGAEGTSFPMSALAGSPQDWAFAFYGGNFYVFLQRASDSSTDVWYLDGSTGAVSELLDNTGRSIVGAGESTCVPAETCYGWQSAPCPSGQVCTSGACVSTCTNACTAGATQCDASGNLDTCAVQASGCTDWTAAPCPSGQVCQAGACVLSCASRCTAPDVECTPDGGLQTCDLQPNGCYDWTDSTCPANQACVNGACANTCSNVCNLNAVQCAGSVIQTCDRESTGCTDWDNGMDCGAAGCVNAACCPCVAGTIQCDASGNLEECESTSTTAVTCPTWVTIPCPGGACLDGECYQDCNPQQEFGACPAGAQCVMVPGLTGSDVCALVAADGGYASPNPLPSSATMGAAGAAGAAAGTNGSGGAGTGGNTHGGTTGGASGATIGGAGSGGTTGSEHGVGTLGGAGGSGGSSEGLGGASGSGSTTSGSRDKGDGSVAATGCGCFSGSDLSPLALILVAAARRRRRLIP